VFKISFRQVNLLCAFWAPDGLCSGRKIYTGSIRTHVSYSWWRWLQGGVQTKSWLNNGAPASGSSFCLSEFWAWSQLRFVLASYSTWGGGRTCPCLDRLLEPILAGISALRFQTHRFWNSFCAPRFWRPQLLHAEAEAVERPRRPEAFGDIFFGLTFTRFRI
jgi:hypothetical protein